MAFNFNGNTPKKILYNGLNVAKLVCNGVVVWMSKVLATISGILPLTLTDCTGDDLVDYKIYGNTEEVLPRGYTQVEYLESTGTQYINTRYYPNNLTEVECKFMYNQFTGNTASSVFGVRDSDGSVRQFLMSVSSGKLWVVSGLNNRSINGVSPVVHTEYVIRIAPQGAYWNGTKILDMTNSVANCPDYSMFMFGRHVHSGSGLANQFYGKIYYLKIYEAGVLVRNFIPCKNQSNVAGMYDTVNGVFYTNAGTGTFNTGSVVSKTSVGDLVTDTSDTNYGKYKIPVLTNSHTTNIYLNKPLRRASKFIAGAEVETVYYTDYLDYENQKVVRNVDDNDKGLDTSIEESIVLPAVATDEGTVTVDVDTEIAPSCAEIKYYKNGS